MMRMPQREPVVCRHTRSRASIIKSKCSSKEVYNREYIVLSKYLTYDTVIPQRGIEESVKK